jgi:hypothetical protein
LRCEYWSKELPEGQPGCLLLLPLHLLLLFLNLHLPLLLLLLFLNLHLPLSLTALVSHLPLFLQVVLQPLLPSFILKQCAHLGKLFNLLSPPCWGRQQLSFSRL